MNTSTKLIRWIDYFKELYEKDEISNVYNISRTIRLRKQFYENVYKLPHNEVEWLFDDVGRGWIKDENNKSIFIELPNRLANFESVLDNLDIFNEETMRYSFNLFVMPVNFKIKSNKFISDLAMKLWYMEISMSSAKKVCEHYKKLRDTNKDFYWNDNKTFFDLDSYIESENLLQNNNVQQIKSTIEIVLQKMEKQVLEYKSGKIKVFGSFIGGTLKLLPTANSEIVNELIIESLK